MYLHLVCPNAYTQSGECRRHRNKVHGYARSTEATAATTFALLDIVHAAGWKPDALGRWYCPGCVRNGKMPRSATCNGAEIDIE